MNTMTEKITAQQLQDQLIETSTMEIDGWLIKLDVDGIWLTNPYGVDCGFFDIDMEACSDILKLIYTDTHTNEWGTL